MHGAATAIDSTGPTAIMPPVPPGVFRVATPGKPPIPAFPSARVFR